jgi:hypothetical protein
MSQENRQTGALQEGLRHAAEDQFANPAMPIGADHQEIGVGGFRCSMQNLGD